MTDQISKISNELSMDIRGSGKIYFNKNIVILKPNMYIANTKNCLSDYHFSLPLTEPPPIKVGKKEYEMKAHHVLAINPEETVTITSNKQYILTREYTALFINKRNFQEIAYDMCGKSTISFANINNQISDKLKLYFELFAEEYKNTQPGHQIMLDTICAQIVIGLIRELKSNISDKIPKDTYGNKKHINRVIEFMEEHYNSSINLDDLCQLANLSLYHFIRLFKKETGKTPHEFLTDIKIRKALEMLKRNQYSINEITQMCGFVNQSHFCSVFKKRIGESASSYRKKL